MPCRPEDYETLTNEELWEVFLALNTACEEVAVVRELQRRGELS